MNFIVRRGSKTTQIRLNKSAFTGYDNNEKLVKNIDFINVVLL